MEHTITGELSIDRRLAQHLKILRTERGWPLDELARRSDVSRATLSRLENGEVSPTASVLGKLAMAYGLTISRLMRMVEDDFAPLLRREQQPVWTDPETGFHRRSVSPPARNLAGEVIEGELPPGASISYDGPPRPGLEHHIVMLDGALTVSVGGQSHALGPGDCLRYQLFAGSRFETPKDKGAHYLLFIV
jgi:transcriptional regulator with XRE-family HTH domain